MKQPAETNEPDEHQPKETPPAEGEPPASPAEDTAPAFAPESGGDGVQPGQAAGGEPEVDVRAGLETMPLAGAGSTPSLGTDEVGWGGPELVESVYAPLSEFYEQIDARLRTLPEDVRPVGWAPHIAALRALRNQQVAGDWEVLARFLVAPGSLAGTDALRLVHVEEGGEADAVRRAIKEFTASDARTLLIAPTPAQASELLRGLEDDPEVFSLLIETRPETAEAPSVETRALPPIEDEPPAAPEKAAPPPLREPGTHGTIEFKPLTTPPAPETLEGDSASTVTRVEPLPPLPPEAAEDENAAVRPAEPLPGTPVEAEDGDSASAVTRMEPIPALPPEVGEGVPSGPGVGVSAPECRVRAAALRPVGEAWRQAWDTEVRMLRRGLMWLEQWPRDAAALRSVQAENLRRGEELEAEKAALRGGIEEAANAAAGAERGAVEAEAEAERLAAVQQEAEAELAGPRAEADRLQAEADRAADEATAKTRTADASYARCAQLDERAKTAQSELRGAREAEASLTDELARAREALPAAAEEAHRLTAADADAAAEGHAAYYRLVSAESALSAVRRKMTLGQRLHVASPPAELSGLRAEAKARTREADEAARRAREAKDAAEHAERVRRGLASFVSEGGTRLRQAQEAQERLGTELTWLATEREKAGAEHREHARLASEAVERATEASLRARAAHQAAQEIEDRVTAARTSREEALAAAVRARTDAEAAAAKSAEMADTLERRTAEAAEEMAARGRDLETVAQTEAGTRQNVAEICGADPTEDPEAVPAHQRRAMARIEQLTGYMEGGRAVESEILLRTADVVVGTPLGAALTGSGQEFDALIVADAGALTDAEFLIGAVRTHRWVLIGAPGSRPPGYREYAGGPSGRLERSPFERAALAAGD
ncbi:hypothetical protein [Actinomadura latina]|uniref:Uncharacterized protein n=1 Tax=Actinomadura latina TaxID=163603 RepID=A0A846Z800_9ACTN|nr:hypothetical protein [Actinomadura latina]NKZ07917.1 hypothetical protein [Actinomadura latina]